MGQYRTSKVAYYIKSELTLLRAAASNDLKGFVSGRLCRSTVSRRKRILKVGDFPNRLASRRIDQVTEDSLKTLATAALMMTLALFAVSAPALAHHGTANYDTEKSVSVTGNVTDFQFVNPHVLIYMQAKDASGKMVAWQGELTSPNRLSRTGWKKDTVKPGEVITITGYPAKSGSPEIWIQKVSLADGTKLDTSGGN